MDLYLKTFPLFEKLKLDDTGDDMKEKYICFNIYLDDIDQWSILVIQKIKLFSILVRIKLSYIGDEGDLFYIIINGNYLEYINIIILNNIFIKT